MFLFPINIIFSSELLISKASEKIKFFSNLLKIAKQCRGNEVYDYKYSKNSFYFLVDAQKMIGNDEISDSLKGMKKFKI